METGKSDVTYKGLEFVLRYVIFTTVAEAVGKIARLPEDSYKTLVKALKPFESDLGAALRELNNHVKHRATQGKKQVLRDAHTQHQNGTCVDDASCGNDAADCPLILEAIQINQEFSENHIPPSGSRSKGPVTQKQAQDLGMTLAASLPADLLDKVNRGEITILEAAASLANN